MNIHQIITACCLLFFSITHAQPSENANHLHSIEVNPAPPKMEERCGISIDIPNLKNVFDQSLEFNCSGSYKNGGYANLDMDFQYDPNRNAGGEHIEFDVQEIGIEENMSRGTGGIFFKSSRNSPPNLMEGASFGGSNCGPVKNREITPIQGIN